MELKKNKNYYLFFLLISCLLLISCENKDKYSLFGNSYINFHYIFDSSLFFNWIYDFEEEDQEIFKNEIRNDIQNGLSSYQFALVYGTDFYLPHKKRGRGTDVMNFLTKEVELGIITGNISSDSRKFMFRLFINYEIASFRIIGTEDYVYEFIFEVPGFYEIDIPFVINQSYLHENKKHRLTGIQIVEPFVKSTEVEHLFWPSMSFNHVAQRDLVIGLSSESIELINHNSILNEIENNIFGGFNILEPDFEYFSNGGVKPIRHLKANPGEKIELSFAASFFGFYWWNEDRQSYDYRPQKLRAYEFIFIGLLNRNPILLNGNPYLFVEIP